MRNYFHYKESPFRTQKTASLEQKKAHTKAWANRSWHNKNWCTGDSHGVQTMRLAFLETNVDSLCSIEKPIRIGPRKLRAYPGCMNGHRTARRQMENGHTRRMDNISSPKRAPLKGGQRTFTTSKEHWMGRCRH